MKHRVPYPHYCWHAYEVAVQSPRIMTVHECRHVAHHLWLTTDGEATIHWATGAGHTSYRVGIGSLGYFPCDGEVHTFTITSAVGLRSRVICIPDDHLPIAAEPATDRHRPAFRDPSIRGNFLRLTAAGDGFTVAEDAGAEIDAREIVVRLGELLAGGWPEWQAEASGFGPEEMRRIVGHLDANLAGRIALASLSEEFGLSPSQFARKLQQSVGLSLNRFVHRRRVRAAFRSLTVGSPALSGLSLGLGFSSQSHFTRVFSGLTGMTPMQVRRLRTPPPRGA